LLLFATFMMAATGLSFAVGDPFLAAADRGGRHAQSIQRET
jgi:hypothetical protein